MAEFNHLRTTTVMLERLLDPADDAIWRDFDAYFRPVIESVARRVGLEAADAADVAQETLAQFARDFRDGKYDRQRGRLRAWITGIAQHRIIDAQRRKAHRREHRGISAIVELPANDRLSEFWEAECRQTMLFHAMKELGRTRKVSPRTIEAFRLHVFEQRTPEQVAGQLGTSVRAVYLAKHRCLGRLREVMNGLKEIYDLA